jgi:predicted metal-dependent hydrolase
VSQIQPLIQVIRETTKRWVDITAIIATITGSVFGILAYFNGAVVVTNLPSSCDGFLANDPSSYVITTSVSKKEEKEYLKNKINCYRDQIQKNPNNAVAYTNMGEAERRLGNLVAAYNAHQKALELKPDLPEAMKGLVLIEQERVNKVVADQAIKRVILHELNDVEATWQKAKALEAKLPIRFFDSLSVNKES